VSGVLRRSEGDFEEIVPLSAATGAGVDTLVDLILDRMPEGPPYFPEGQITDQTIEQRVAEIVREKAITLMREEMPHSIAVVVEEMGAGEADDVGRLLGARVELGYPYPFEELESALHAQMPSDYGCVFTGSGDYHHLSQLLLNRLPI
jgi:hypothetical protein